MKKNVPKAKSAMIGTSATLPPVRNCSPPAINTPASVPPMRCPIPPPSRAELRLEHEDGRHRQPEPVHQVYRAGDPQPESRRHRDAQRVTENDRAKTELRAKRCHRAPQAARAQPRQRFTPGETPTGIARTNLRDGIQMQERKAQRRPRH